MCGREDGRDYQERLEKFWSRAPQSVVHQVTADFTTNGIMVEHLKASG